MAKIIANAVEGRMVEGTLERTRDLLIRDLSESNIRLVRNVKLSRV